MNASGPLGQLKVVEFEGKGAAPFAARLLADLGAAVTVVARARAGAVHERLLGDDHNPLRRGKTLVRLDLKDEAGLAAAIALVRASDVVVEGFRPGVMERLGLGPRECAAVQPRIVYGRLSGWGQSGAQAATAGHELNYLALAGLLAPERPGEPPPRVPATTLGDAGAAVTFAFGLVAAVQGARDTGCGCVVDAAMVDAAAQLGTIAQWMRARGQIGGEGPGLFYESPFYDLYRCADGGFVAVAALEPPFYQAVLAGLGVDDVDPALQFDRATWPATKARIAAAFLARPRDAWAAKFAATDACVTPVLTPAEAARHPANVERGVFRDGPDATSYAAPAPRFAPLPGGDGFDKTVPIGKS
ncbi:MAG: CaiB/BaiF CoA-transferase family protein [Proteobacteria bacterium]|nr:CaiB/BaiF CoA-transferase family protein [Pseudomonadota bacterium]